MHASMQDPNKIPFQVGHATHTSLGIDTRTSPFLLRSRAKRDTMKIAVFATLLASAAAFSPVKQAAKTSALSAFENELGAQEPVSHSATH